jgi:cephalosporin-C deacetylase-like acetyl esterase
MILPAALAAPAFAQPVSGAVKVGFADTRSEIDRDRIVVLGWSDGGALLAALKHIEHEGEKAMAARACNRHRANVVR